MHNASKENATPASSQAGKGNGRPSISTLGLTSRAKSLQPLSSATLNRAQPTIHSTEHIPSDVRLKHQSSPVVSSLQPRIRATLRPISPDKQSRRPRSAFDLRSINTAQPRPASELRRPALMLNASTRSLVRDDTLHPADDIVDRSGSVTPGQRMADKFLKERKSTGVLIPDTPRYRGGLKLTREDTPAFL